jgi:hypothetical protein
MTLGVAGKETGTHEGMQLKWHRAVFSEPDCSRYSSGSYRSARPPMGGRQQGSGVVSDAAATVDRHAYIAKT